MHNFAIEDNPPVSPMREWVCCGRTRRFSGRVTGLLQDLLGVASLAKGGIGGRIPVVAMKAGAAHVVVVSERKVTWLFASAFSSCISGITIKTPANREAIVIATSSISILSQNTSFMLTAPSCLSLSPSSTPEISQLLASFGKYVFLTLDSNRPAPSFVVLLAVLLRISISSGGGDNKNPTNRYVPPL